MNIRILKFYADWCSPCKELSEVLTKISLKIKIENIDIDTPNKQNLVEKYNIRSLPTLIFINENNEELERIVGTATINKIQSIISKYEDNDTTRS